MSVAPQIDNGKKPFDYYNGLAMTPLPANTPFGNLLAAKLFIDRRVDYLNYKLTKLYERFPVKIEGVIPPLYPEIIDIPTEELIYLTRRSADDLICLWSILSDFTKNGKYSDEISIDHVGALIADILKLGITHDLQSHAAWLRNLNEVANAYKHSFAQTQRQQFSAQQPLVIAFEWRRNHTQNPVTPRLIPLSEIIAGCSLFYQQINTWLKDWSKANPDNHQSSKYNL